jgi:hypothetical protein
MSGFGGKADIAMNEHSSGSDPKRTFLLGPFKGLYERNHRILGGENGSTLASFLIASPIGAGKDPTNGGKGAEIGGFLRFVSGPAEKP